MEQPLSCTLIRTSLYLLSFHKIPNSPLGNYFSLSRISINGSASPFSFSIRTLNE